MFRITGFLDFVHSPEFYITRKYNVLETEFLPVFGEESETLSVLGHLQRANLNKLINQLAQPILLCIYENIYETYFPECIWKLYRFMLNS
jgi:hypothetical protein